MSLEPSLVLSVLVGIFHAALSVVIRGSAGGRLPLLVAAAILGAAWWRFRERDIR